MNQQDSQHLDTIVTCLRYRRERLGNWEPIHTKFTFEITKPLIPFFREDAPLGVYSYGEEVGPDLESLRSTVEWATRVNQPFLPRFVEELGAGLQHVANHQRWRMVSLSSHNGIKIKLRQQEDSADLHVTLHDGTYTQHEGVWTSESDVTPEMSQSLTSAADLLSRLEKRIDREVTEHEVARLQSRLRIADQMYRSATWMEETRFTGGATRWETTAGGLLPPHRVWQHSIAADLEPAELARRIDEGMDEHRRVPTYEEQLARTRAGTRDKN